MTQQFKTRIKRFKIYFIQLYKCCYYKVLNINTQTKLKPKLSQT